MIESSEPSAECPVSPIPSVSRSLRRQSPGHVPRPRPRGRNRVVRGVVGLTVSVLAAVTVLVTGAPSAFAMPAVQPLSTGGYVPSMGLNMVNGAALHCPAGVTTWSPMILPIEMAIPRGAPDGAIDPLNVKNMPDGSGLWYRDLGSLRTGGPMVLDRDWTQDGRSTMPIIRTGLRSGTYLLGALCAIPGKDRQTFPLDSAGNLIGEWYVVTFTWVDKVPTQGTYRFERQYVGPGVDSAPVPTATPRPAAVQHRHTSGGMGWQGWLAIGGGAVLVLLLFVIGFGRRRNGSSGPVPYPVSGTPPARQLPEDK